MWLALPPWSFGPLGWVAPIPWLWLVRGKALHGRRPYRALWLAGFVFWLLAVHWLRLPHRATSLGWLAMAFCLAFYLPVFVGLTRVAVHHARVPLLVAAPIVWTGLELVRAHLITGFLMAALAHTQVRWVGLIQISDLAGGYAVSFVIMLVAACLARMGPCGEERRCFWPLVPAAVVLAAVLGYGHWRTEGGGKAPDDGAKRIVNVALIQGSIDADWKSDSEKTARIFKEYFELSQEASQTAAGQLDLIVWPETMLPHALLVLADDFSGPTSQAPTGSERSVEEILADTPRLIAQMVEQLEAPLLLGVETRRYHNEDDADRLNSAVLAGRQGQIVGRYDKLHLVMFGEYVPLAQWFPGLYRLTPLGGGLTSGHAPVVLEVEGVRYAPNICFESVLPHLVARQLRASAARGEPPDVLVNLTNDAWFWGSSELDMHLACGVFRAVEFRKPFLIASNSGLSAWIDSDGRIREQGPRRRKAVIHAAVELDRRESLYLAMGDWPAGLCVVLGGVWAALGAWRRWWRPETLS